MTPARFYPDEAAGPFDPPPREFEDGESRAIRVEVAGDDHGDPLVAMYEEFDPADRAQGIPPVRSDRIREWVDQLLDEGLNAVAVHDDRVVGHATLVPGHSESHELAIFVDQDYQGAGIGTVLLRALLGHGEREGVECVWLTVERWNRPAITLYERVGFETYGSEAFEREMTIRLCDPPGDTDAG